MFSFLMCFLTSICQLTAAAPVDLISDLRANNPKKIYATGESMPQQLKDTLRKTFKQRRLALANRSEPIRDMSLIFDAPRVIPPMRRLISAFETANFFIVYYQAAGYEKGAKVLAFRKQKTGLTFAWGGVSFTCNLSATPAWITQQITRHRFLDDAPFIW